MQNKKIESAELDRKDRIMTEKYTISDLTTIREILQMAIEREKISYQFYMDALYRATSTAEHATFERLAVQEQEHQKILEGMLAEIDACMFTDRALSGTDVL